MRLVVPNGFSFTLFVLFLSLLLSCDGSSTSSDSVHDTHSHSTDVGTRVDYDTFHISPEVAAIFPDSALLIVLGLVLGGVFALGRLGHDVQDGFTPAVFFLYMLPPIILDAGYFMPPRPFFYNLGTILIYAVFGTLWNVIAIGGVLYWLRGWFLVELGFVELFLFSSIISAVDPVAVLVVFEEIHVNELLYICVFGESLLNDAVTVVLYNMLYAYTEIGAVNLVPADYVNGFLSFFVVSLGGIIIGLVGAVATGFATKYTDHVTVLQPLICLLFPYMAYLCAEMLHLSAILAIVTCGLVMKTYIKGNISSNSQVTVSYFMKTLSSSAETVIFVFLGLTAVSTVYDYGVDWAFVGVTIVACFIFRFIGVFTLTALVNPFRMQRISVVDQFIMAYGGLRGAVAFGLVDSISETIVPAKGTFVSTTIIVILFTVFVQGTTIKKLVYMLNVRLASKEKKTITEEMFMTLQEYVLAGMEEITGQRGHYWLQNVFRNIDSHYLRPCLMRSVHRKQDRIVRYNEKLKEREAMEQIGVRRDTIGRGRGREKHVVEEQARMAISALRNIVPGVMANDSSGVAMNGYSRWLLDEDMAHNRKRSQRRRSHFHRQSAMEVPDGRSKARRSSAQPSHERDRSRTEEGTELLPIRSKQRRFTVDITGTEEASVADNDFLQSLSDNDYVKVRGAVTRLAGSDVPVMPVYCVKRSDMPTRSSKSVDDDDVFQPVLDVINENEEAQYQYYYQQQQQQHQPPKPGSSTHRDSV